MSIPTVVSVSYVDLKNEREATILMSDRTTVLFTFYADEHAALPPIEGLTKQDALSLITRVMC